MRDTGTRYGAISVFSHWTAAILVIGLLVLALVYEELPRGADRDFLKGLHISIGALAVLPLLFRVAWRILSRSPAPLPGPRWQVLASRIVHGLLLASIAVLALGGPLIVWANGDPLPVFGLGSIPSPLPAMHDLGEALEEVHEFAAIAVLLPLLAAHLLAVLGHTAIARDGTLGRMLGRSPAAARAGAGVRRLAGRGPAGPGLGAPSRSGDSGS